MTDNDSRPLTPAAIPTGQTATVRRRRRRLPPGLVRAAQAAAWCSVSVRVWRSWDSAGVCPRPAMRTRGIVLWSLKTLRLWRDLGCVPRKEFEGILAVRNGQHAERHTGRLPR
jgi:hypothetical protein